MVVRMSRLQSSFSDRPSRPRMSIRVSAPVPASKPVAKIKTSNSYSLPSFSFSPFGVTRSIGLSLTLTTSTFGRRNASRKPTSSGTRCVPKP